VRLALEAARWASIGLQLLTAVLALRLVPVSRRRAAWVLISAALVLMTALRLLPMTVYLRGGSPPPADGTQEALRLVISVLLLVAVVQIRPYFVAFRDAEDRLTAERNRARSYLDAAGSILLGLDPKGRVTMLNSAGRRLLGMHESDLLGRDWFEVALPEAERERERRRFAELTSSRGHGESYHESHVVDGDGRERLIAWRHTCIRNEATDETLCVCSGDDITEERGIEQDLRFRSFMLDSATDSIFVHGPEGRLIYANEEAWRSRGWSRDEMLALPPYGWVEAPQDEIEQRTSRIFADGSRIFESTNRRADGSTFPVEVHARALRTGSRDVVVSIVRDITERKHVEEVIVQMAYYDPLTELANRTLFNDRLAVAIAQAHRNGERLAVLFLDVDHFKTINDTLGHAVGDQLLVGIAKRLASLMREGDTVARLGGDEFTLLLPYVSKEEDAAAVARKVIEALRPPFTLGEHEIHATASIGIAMYGGAGDTAETLLKNADTAMYRAKEKGRNGFAFYDPRMNETALDRFALKNDLRKVLERGELDVHYQPLVRVADGRIAGAEALLRWNHPERGDVPPAEFVPLAEESGVIVAVGDWVLRRACSDALAWHGEGFPDVRVAVNLSARQFLHADLVSSVRSVLADTGLPPHLLELVITESIAMQNGKRLIETFRRLRGLGVRIAIDDFGTGYSSLDRIKRFPIQTLKVAQPFMDGVCDDEDSAAIASTIIVLAQSLKLNVVAEGVETAEQLEFLQKRACPEMQGFLCSAPVPLQTFTALLRRNEVAPFRTEPEDAAAV
jgi:diguanylate cyclase (GGDEF)-like protein/PAS domain S-box-containing protein